MTLYYAQINSERIAYAVTQTAEPVQGADLVALESFDIGVVGRRHDLASGQWLAVPAPQAPPDWRVSRKAFLSRFTDAEAIDIDLASMGATRDAAGLRRYLSKVNAADYIDLLDDETRGGVLTLELAGLIGPGRAAEILDTPIDPKELP